MPTHPFLSARWIAETRRLREEYRSRLQTPTTPPLRMNLVVTDVPFDPGRLDAHLDTSAGEPEIDLGHLPDAEVSVQADYATAKRVFVDADLGAAMEALQLGRVKVDGDMMKLMSLASIGTADPASMELARAIRAITE